MLKFFASLLISSPILFWFYKIGRHWHDKERPRVWYWRIWWSIAGHFYPINWWWTGQKQYWLKEPKKLKAWLKNLFKRKTTTVKRRSFLDFVAGKKDVTVYGLVRKTAGGHHAWYNSNVGLIRKPIFNDPAV